jgi:hypothetical protein
MTKRPLETYGGAPDAVAPSVSLREFEFLVHGAFRYALGRRTHVVHDMCELLRAVLPNCGVRLARQMQHEITDAIRYGKAGGSPDVEQWSALLAWMRDGGASHG